MAREHLIRAQGLGLLISGLVVCVSSVLPWVAHPDGVGFESGLAFGEGRATLALGITLFLLGTLRLSTPGTGLDNGISLAAAVLAGAVITITLHEIMAIRSEAATIRDLINAIQAIQLTKGPPAVGYGLHLALVGGCLAALSSLLGLALSLPLSPVHRNTAS